MIDYSEDCIFELFCHFRGCVASRRALYFAIPCSILTGVLIKMDEWSPTFREEHQFDELTKSQLWTATTGVLSILLGFRTNRAMSRFWEGTGLLHQMRGEWFDSVSCCVTFSRGALDSKHKEVMHFRHTIVRLMSLCHGSALAEIAGEDAETVQVIDSFGLSNRTLRHLKICKQVHGFNSVEVLLHLIQSLITYNIDTGVLKIPPPILSRVYQTLSRGFVNLLNAKKIADTRFPFPYAQLIAVLLLLHALLTPIMIASVFSSVVWGMIFTFVPIYAMFTTNYIGVELENPFGNDDNDLPLAHFQNEMNTCLLMLLEGNADMIADISESRCIQDFEKLHQTMHEELEGSRPMHRINSFTEHMEISDFESEIDDVMRVKSGHTSIGSSYAHSLGPSVPRSPRESFPQQARAAGLEPKEKKLASKPEKDAQVFNVADAAASPDRSPGESLAYRRPARKITWSADSYATSDAADERDVPIAEEATVVPAPSDQEGTMEKGSAVEAPIEPGGILPSWPQDVFSVGAGAKTPPVLRLETNVKEFNACLQRWTKQVNEQISDLGRSFAALQEVNLETKRKCQAHEAVAPSLADFSPQGNKWRLAQWTDHQAENPAPPPNFTPTKFIVPEAVC